MLNNQPEALIQKFFSPRPAGELDLVAAARQALVEAGIAEQGIAAFDSDPNIIFAVNKNGNVQRFKLNTWLDTQYLSSQMEVSNQRSMLMETGPLENWIEIFKKFHIPSMKTLNLPRAY